MSTAGLPERLPATFTYRQAHDVGLSRRRLYELRDRGDLEAIGRGLYRRADAEPVDYDLLEIAIRARLATICLTSALVHHELTDANPPAVDMAIPTGAHRPRVAARVKWHVFDPERFHIGRETMPVDSETSIGLYNAERSIIDAFRLRYQEGEDLAYVALRRWLRRRAGQPAALYRMAQDFPQARKALRQALEILLHE